MLPRKHHSFFQTVIEVHSSPLGSFQSLVEKLGNDQTCPLVYVPQPHLSRASSSSLQLRLAAICQMTLARTRHCEGNIIVHSTNDSNAEIVVSRQSVCGPHFNHAFHLTVFLNIWSPIMVPSLRQINSNNS